MKKNYLIWMICLMMYSNMALAQYETKTFNWNMNAYEKLTFTNASGSMPYRLLKPLQNDPARKYPLVIMLHGEGEGIGQPCTNQNGINVCNLLWGGKMHLDSINKYPSFVVFPQTHGGDWKSEVYLSQLKGLLEYLFIHHNIDLDRVTIHGLSGGGSGVWTMAYRYPHLFAGISPHSASGDPAQAAKILYSPLWTVQGEGDTNPKPGVSLTFIDALRNSGRRAVFTYDLNTNKQQWPNPKTVHAGPLYTSVPSGGHVVWAALYNSPAWLAWMYAQNKNQIVVLGRTTISPGETVKLGVAPGFDAYQWSNGATGNQITVNSAGTYQVRYLRKAYFFSGTPQWSAWSAPVTITVNPSLGPVADAGRDARVASSAGNTRLRGYGAGSNISYKWIKLSGGNVSIASANTHTPYLSGFQGGTYTFRLTVTDASGKSAFDDVKLIVSAGDIREDFTYDQIAGDDSLQDSRIVTLYPNPLSDEVLHVSFDTGQSHVRVEVYDHLGNRIYHQENESPEVETDLAIDLRPLQPDHTYMVRISSDEIVNRMIRVIKK